MKDTHWCGAAHVLATITHLVMGIVGTVTFNDTVIETLGDSLTAPSVPSMISQTDKASFVQGAAAVGWVGFVFNLAYFTTLLWTDHKIAIDDSRNWYFRRKVTVLGGVLVACGSLIGDITLASILGKKGPRLAVGLIAVSAIAGFFMAVTIISDLARLHILDGDDKKLSKGTEKNQQQA